LRKKKPKGENDIFRENSTMKQFSNQTIQPIIPENPGCLMLLRGEGTIKCTSWLAAIPSALRQILDPEFVLLKDLKNKSVAKAMH
jgi:hypothetical protein